MRYFDKGRPGSIAQAELGVALKQGPGRGSGVAEEAVRAASLAVRTLKQTACQTCLENFEILASAQ